MSFLLAVRADGTFMASTTTPTWGVESRHPCGAVELQIYRPVCPAGAGNDYTYSMGTLEISHEKEAGTEEVD